MNKKIWFVIIILIVIGGIGGVSAWYFTSNNHNNNNNNNIINTPCTSDTPFTALPVNLSKIANIVPLGNLDPPGHTYPTDHMYFFGNTTEYPDGFEIYAPGNFTITSVQEVLYGGNYSSSIKQDYAINFYVCKDVWGIIGHIDNLSAYMLNQTGEFGSQYGDKVNSWKVATSNQTEYTKSLMLNVTAGTFLGIGGMDGGLDFWLKDNRVNLYFVNTTSTIGYTHGVCPLNYFTNSLRTQLETKLANWNGAPIYPNATYCGRISYDVPNTAQGIWTIGSYSNSTGLHPEDMGLALVYDNFNASKGAISIGLINQTWDSQVYYFSPTDSGNINRKFSDVTNDGTIYVYRVESYYNGPVSNDKAILIKMVSDTSLRLQFLDTNGTSLPSDPSTLWNESNSFLFIR